MTMKKKLLTTLSVVLILGLAALGILAYLTDTNSDVNVMTLGNVSIEQNEYQRVQNEDGTYKTDTIDNQTSYVLEDFEQGKALLPIVGDPSISGSGYAGWDDTVVRMTQKGSYGSMQVFAGKNAEDKFVVVKNTGKTNAYVRTMVAIEVGSTDGSLIGTSYHNTWKQNEVGTVKIDENNYYVIEYVYAGGKLSDGSWRHENGVLPARDTAYPNLSQVYIKSVATNENCAALDGNGNGTLDILVLSQAVQAEGFADAQTALDTAFGEASVEAANWFGGMKAPAVVKKAEELKAAIEAGEEVILLGDNITVEKGTNLTFEEDAKIDLAGNDLVISGGASLQTTSGELNIVNNSGEEASIVLGSGSTIKASGANSVVNVENVDITTGTKATERIQVMNGATFNMYDGKIVSTGKPCVNIENGTFNMYGGEIVVPSTCTSSAFACKGEAANNAINLYGGKITVASGATGINTYKLGSIFISEDFVFELEDANAYSLTILNSQAPTITGTEPANVQRI